MRAPLERTIHAPRTSHRRPADLARAPRAIRRPAEEVATTVDIVRRMQPAPLRTSAPTASAHAAVRAGAVSRLLYAELRRLARSRLASGGRHTLLDTSALVHEAFLRMQRDGGVTLKDREHFLAYAATTMRSVVIDFVRRRSAERRGGDVEHVTLDTRAAEELGASDEEILAVHERARHAGEGRRAPGARGRDALLRRTDRRRDRRRARRHRSHGAPRLGTRAAAARRPARPLSPSHAHTAGPRRHDPSRSPSAPQRTARSRPRAARGRARRVARQPGARAATGAAVARTARARRRRHRHVHAPSRSTSARSTAHATTRATTQPATRSGPIA